MDPVLPSNEISDSGTSATRQSSPVISDPSIPPDGNECHFLKHPTVNLHRSLRVRRSQIIHTAILFANKRVNEEAVCVLYKETIICLTARDLLCLDSAETLEAYRQRFWHSMHPLYYHRTSILRNGDNVLIEGPLVKYRDGPKDLPLMKGLIDPSVFNRYEKVHIALGYTQFGLNFDKPSPKQIALRLHELEAEYDIFEFRHQEVLDFLRDIKTFEILVRVLSRLPKLKLLSLDVSVLIWGFGSTLIRYQQDHTGLRKMLMVLRSMQALEYATHWFAHLLDLSNVEAFTMKLYCWANENGQQCDEAAAAFDVPPIVAQRLELLKTIIKGRYVAPVEEEVKNIAPNDNETAVSGVTQ
ncbi:hypothetical protein BKA64DRAFT_707924 [Cadophora sp. MPI-SDFR-AT-0126]|nr:hypothetical protein BKA64DRAFT_707924 [Leotiomycetes sp. MPI-SDFR-AT-0126]